MTEEPDTQALVWLRAVQKQMKELQSNLENCIRGHVSGKPDQEEFDKFVQRLSRFSQRVIASADKDQEG